MFFAITSLGISRLPVGPYIPIMNTHKRIIMPIEWVEYPYSQEVENGWLKKLKRHLGGGVIMYGIPFQEAEENKKWPVLPRKIRPNPKLPGPIYIKKAEKNAFRPIPMHPPPYFQEDENGWFKKFKRYLGAGGVMVGIPFQEAEENRWPRPTRPDPIFPGPIYIQKAEKNAFRPIPMHPPPYFQEDENGWFKKLAKRVGVGAAIKILLQEAEENGPFEPIPIHPPPHFQEDENGWLKKLAKRVGVGAAIKILLQEAEENGPFEPIPIHPPPHFQEDENGWLKKLKRYIGGGAIMYGIPFQEAEENSMWTKFRDGVLKPAVIEAILRQEQEENRIWDLGSCFHIYPKQK